MAVGVPASVTIDLSWEAPFFVVLAAVSATLVLVTATLGVSGVSAVDECLGSSTVKSAESLVCSIAFALTVTLADESLVLEPPALVGDADASTVELEVASTRDEACTLESILLSTTASKPLSAPLVVADCRSFRTSIFFAADDLVDAMRELDPFLELRVTGMALDRDTPCLVIQMFASSLTQTTIMELSSDTQLNRTRWF